MRGRNVNMGLSPYLPAARDMMRCAFPDEVVEKKAGAGRVNRRLSIYRVAIAASRKCRTAIPVEMDGLSCNRKSQVVLWLALVLLRCGVQLERRIRHQIHEASRPVSSRINSRQLLEWRGLGIKNAESGAYEGSAWKR